MDEVLFGRVIDAPLSIQGERQAAALAAHLAPERDVLIATSPRLRTQQTAHAISAATGSPVHLAPDIDEIDFGRWSGQRFEQLASDPGWRDWNEHRDSARTPAGDCIADVQRRAMRQLHRMHATHPHRTVALVTHAEVIRALLIEILRLHANAYQTIDITPGSITRLSCQSGALAVSTINEQILQ
jgi:broad specificity phosphatase PhoE